jgi:hypothetical protein
MSVFSNIIEDAISSHTLRGVAYPIYGNIEVGLFTSSPGEAQGITSEVSGGGYARFSGVTNEGVLFPACAPTGVPTKTNALPIQFPTASGSWGIVTHWAIFEPTVTFVANTTTGSPTITSVISTDQFKIGSTITGSGIPTDSVIISKVLNTSITISKNATSSGTGVSLKAHVMIAHAPLSASRTVITNDSPRIMPGEMVFTLNNLGSGGLTDYTKRKILDHLFTAIVFQSPAVVFTGAGTSLVGDVMTEWTDAGYTRQATIFIDPVNGVTSNSSILTLNASVVSQTGPITSIGIFDAQTSGNALYVGNMASTKIVGIGNSAKIQASTILITLS